MKYLESINDIKLEVSNIIMDCKDIMLELEDNGAEIEVKKELFKDKLKVTCYISCNRRIFFKIKQEILETIERLKNFMKIKGFDIQDYYKEITYIEISFLKEMDNDYIGHLRYLKKYNIKENYSKKFTPEEILEELSLELTDNGLYIDFPNDNKFGGKFYLEISDRDKKYCKEWPINDMDWLWGKKVVLDFIKELEDFGFIMDSDYKIYAGGLYVNIVFENKNKIKL